MAYRLLKVTAAVVEKARHRDNAATWTTAKAGCTAIRTVNATAVPATALYGSPALASGPIIGPASVIDGYTIEIAGERIRFNGIDAPESWQTCATAAGEQYRCGKASAEALDAFLAASGPTRVRICQGGRYEAEIARNAELLIGNPLNNFRFLTRNVMTCALSDGWLLAAFGGR